MSVTQSCLTLCDPMGYSLPGSSVHGILQARILEWVAISFSKGRLGYILFSQGSPVPSWKRRGREGWILGDCWLALPLLGRV